MRRRLGLALEAHPAHLALDGVGVDDLQRDVTAQPRVEGLVRDAHRATAEFVQRAVGPPGDLEMLERGVAGRHRGGRLPLS